MGRRRPFVDVVRTVLDSAPGQGSAPDDHVLITHESGTGRDDSVSRPADEAVALFWRFLIEKYGVHPARGPSS